MDIELGKFVLSILKEIRDIILASKNKKSNLITIGSFIELYGSATRLEGYSEQLLKEDHLYSTTVNSFLKN